MSHRPVRVGMFPPLGLLSSDQEATRTFLAEAGRAGADRVCCGDPVRFARVGFDGPGSVRVLAEGTLIAEAVTTPDGAALELPGPPPVAEARAAGAGGRLRRHPDEHPFPGCFGC